MSEKRVAPYGAWKSPITSDLIVQGTISLSEIKLDRQDVYWIEGRPEEAGRSVIVRCTPDGYGSDVTPRDFNARTRVHEYGSGSYVVHEGIVYFSNFSDNKLYRQALNSAPEALTSQSEFRYADFLIDAQNDRLICVREDHSEPDREAVNTLTTVPLSPGSEQTILVSGNDFYSSPRLSPDGKRLAWLTWNHPNMPWDGTELWIGELSEDGSIGQSRQVAGGPEESIFQPEWSPDGSLYFVSDRSGWWNLYRLEADQYQALTPMEAEFGLPQWGFGMSTYDFADAEEIVCWFEQGGSDHLARLNTGTQELQEIVNDYTVMSYVRVGRDNAFFIGSSPTAAPQVVKVGLTTGESQTLRRSTSLDLDQSYISVAEPIEFPTEGGLTAYALFYPPTNRDFEAPPDELPPLLVSVHGGPTAAASSDLTLGHVQYWTSRGFAVAAVNYGGSSGYGREYRLRLNGQWGVVDVDDSVNCARYLAEQEKVDPARLIIRGGSAGGYTTLCALAFRDEFNAGASLFGLSDLIPFVQDTHKFEARYLDRLVGPYPEAKQLYHDRSAINFMDRFSAPVILLQGLDDKVVPPNQADIMVEGLRRKGVPFAYIAFEGEGHGFRRAENIKRALDSELYFYSRIFGFELAEPVQPVEIENLKEPAASR